MQTHDHPPIAGAPDPEYQARLDADRVTALWRAPITPDERAATRTRRTHRDPGPGALELFPQPEQTALFEEVERALLPDI